MVLGLAAGCSKAKKVTTDSVEKACEAQTGALDLKAADLITYCHGHYYTMGEELGHFGWSVRKKPKTKE